MFIFREYWMVFFYLFIYFFDSGESFFLQIYCKYQCCVISSSMILSIQLVSTKHFHLNKNRLVI